MAQPDWIQVDPSTLAKPTNETLDGIEVTLMTSPYDIPEAFRGFYDRRLERFVIEFKYLAEEPTRRETPHKHVALRAGKNSGRIYGVEIDVEGMKAQWVQLVVTAISERARERHKPRRPANYEVTKRLLRENEPRLSALAC